MPGDEPGLPAVFYLVQQFRGVLGVWSPVQGNVYQYVGIQKYQLRYFSASLSYRGSSCRSAA